MFTKLITRSIVTATLIIGLSSSAFALSVTCTPNDPGDPDLWDLSHGKYYTWGIEADIPTGEVITSASLSIYHIDNWKDEDTDRLFIHLLDSTAVGAVEHSDPDWNTVDYFDAHWVSEHRWLTTYTDPDDAGAPEDITYIFNAYDIAVLTNYINDHGMFGLGFDPDCHFYNNRIEFSYETFYATPEPASLLLLGSGLLGFAYRRKKK